MTVALALGRIESLGIAACSTGGIVSKEQKSLCPPQCHFVHHES